MVNGPGGERKIINLSTSIETGIARIGFEVAPLGVVISTVPFQVTGIFAMPSKVDGFTEMTSATGVPPGPCRLPPTATVPPSMNNQLGGPLICETVAVKGMVHEGVAGAVAHTGPPSAGGALRLRSFAILVGIVIAAPGMPRNAAPGSAGSELSTVCACRPPARHSQVTARAICAIRYH